LRTLTHEVFSHHRIGDASAKAVAGCTFRFSTFTAWVGLPGECGSSALWVWGLVIDKVVSGALESARDNEARDAG
jgi:hypothetical protein